MTLGYTDDDRPKLAMQPQKAFNRKSARCFPMNWNLELVSKQVREEALHTAWESGHKHFLTPERLYEVLIAEVQPTYNWLNRISLSLSLSDFYDFFGIEVALVLHMSQNTVRPHLTSLLRGLGLRHLERRGPTSRTFLTSTSPARSKSLLRRRGTASSSARTASLRTTARCTGTTTMTRP